MKDYTLGKKEEMLFIRNFEEKKDKLIVRFANNKKLPLSIKTRQLTLDKMEEQVLESDIRGKRAKEFVEQFSVSKSLKIIIFLLACSSLFLALHVYFMAFLLLPFEIFSGLIIQKISSEKAILKDIEKNKLLLDYQEVLNDKLNENHLKGVSKKTVKKIESTPINRKVFDLNTIDSMSLKDLKRIRDNIYGPIEYIDEIPNVKKR